MITERRGFSFGSFSSDFFIFSVRGSNNNNGFLFDFRIAADVAPFEVYSSSGRWDERGK